jgi:hypothetical protein
MRSGRLISTIPLLVALTALAVAIHGYHLGIEDQDVYLAAIKKQLNPALYSQNSGFFMLQMRATLFDEFMAFCTRLTHLPVDWVVFFWHIFSIFLILLGCWKISRHCFASAAGRWAGVVLVTGLLTIPIAGTALYLVDQYLHPRALATAAILFAITATLERRYLAVVLWLVAATLMHPLMAAFGVSYVIFLAWRSPLKLPVLAASLPFLAPLPRYWNEASHARTYYFLAQWAWYEWLGIVAPLALAWWFARVAQARGLPVLAHMCRRLVWFGLFQFIVAASVSLPPGMAQLAAFQPMRWMHLYYLLFFLFAGGLVGEFVLRSSVLRWALLFVPLCAGMYFAQRNLFPASRHIEIRPVQNDWTRAFAWIRANTPANAYFAVNPDYMSLPGEDNHGFRALAERSLLAENCKDPGAATVFPELLEPWHEQTEALRGWRQFSASQLQFLHDRFGVDWVVLERDVCCLPCPYRNRSVRVCQIAANAKH